MLPMKHGATPRDAQALQVVLGALRLPLYPPSARAIHDALRASRRPLPPMLDRLRRDLVALPPAQFAAALQAALNPIELDAGFGVMAFGPMGGALAAYGAALVDERQPRAESLRHFRATEADEARVVFMARFFDRLLDHLGEPERSSVEASIIGPAPLDRRRRRWAALVSRSVPAWLSDP